MGTDLDAFNNYYMGEKMKDHFKKQLDIRTPLTELDIACFKGAPLYGPYEPGDLFLAFMEQDLEETERVTYKLIICVDREFPQMEKDYDFLRMTDNGTFPILIKKCDRR